MIYGIRNEGKRRLKKNCTFLPQRLLFYFRRVICPFMPWSIIQMKQFSDWNDCLLGLPRRWGALLQTCDAANPVSVCNHHEVNDKLIHIKERQLSYLLSSFHTCPNFPEEQFIHRDGEKGTFLKKQKAFETYVNNTITAPYLDIFAKFISPRLWIFFRLSVTFASSLPSTPFWSVHLIKRRLNWSLR